MASSFMRFPDHTQRRTTVGRTLPDERLAHRRDLYLTTHNTHNRQTFMSPLRFEPTISAGERPQTYTLEWGRNTEFKKVTLKMKSVCSSETSERLATARCNNPKQEVITVIQAHMSHNKKRWEYDRELWVDKNLVLHYCGLFQLDILPQNLPEQTGKLRNRPHLSTTLRRLGDIQHACDRDHPFSKTQYSGTHNQPLDLVPASVSIRESL